MPKHIKIIDEAKRLVSTRREATYGNKKANHKNIAKLWSAYLDKTISTKDVALMMALLKIARTKLGDHNEDDYVDLVGYGAIAGELADKENEQLEFDFDKWEGTDPD